MSAEINMALSSEESSKGFRIAKGLLAAISEKAGITYTVVNMPNKRSVEELKTGKMIQADLARIESYQNEVKNSIQVKEPIIYVTQNVYVKKGFNGKIDSWNSLQQYRIAYIRGSLAIETKVKGFPNISLLDNVGQAFNFLLAGRCDVFITTDMAGESTRGKAEFKDKEIEIHSTLISEPLYTFFNNAYAEEAKKYEEALIAIKKDGTYKKIVTETH